MKKITRRQSVVALLIVWALFFLLFALHVNIKGLSVIRTPSYANGCSDTFEYKLGFPTPWYSRYYVISDKSICDQYSTTSTKTCRLFDFSCSQVDTPAASYFTWQDKAWDVLFVQALLAFIPVALIVFIYKKLI